MSGCSGGGKRPLSEAVIDAPFSEEYVTRKLHTKLCKSSKHNTLNMAEMRIFLFGNQALVNRAQIQQQLIDSRGNPFLSLLLQRCSDALRHEISQLSPLERENIPAFNTIDELNDRAGNNDAHEGVQNALLCISQLAQYTQ